MITRIVSPEQNTGAAEENRGPGFPIKYPHCDPDMQGSSQEQPLPSPHMTRSCWRRKRVVHPPPGLSAYETDTALTQEALGPVKIPIRDVEMQ